MLKKTHTYYDFDGQQRTEDFYFNLTEAELTELEYSMNGGLSQLLEKIIKEDDQKQIIEYFKKIVIMAYGVKSLDGIIPLTNSAALFASWASSMKMSEYAMVEANSSRTLSFLTNCLPSRLFTP